MTGDRPRWYEEWFNEAYLRVYAHRDAKLAEAETDFLIATLSPSKTSPILDLCCGAGRHLIRLQNLGFQNAVGIDLSPHLLEAAKNSLAGSGQAPGERDPLIHSLPLVRGDMRSLPFGACFQVVLSLFTSFGYFYEEEENQQVLREIRRVLLPGGQFLLDLVPLAAVDRLVAKSERESGDFHIVEKRRFDPIRRRVEKEIEISGPDGQHSFLESVRVYSFGETNRILAEAGLCLTDVRGNFRGGAFQPDSERMILIGKTADR
jgi:SAM-dependent methyltransferase